MKPPPLFSDLDISARLDEVDDEEIANATPVLLGLQRALNRRKLVNFGYV